MIRWLVGLAITIAVAVGLFLLVIQIVVSRTDYARARVQRNLSERTGWRIEVGAIDVGWLGRSTLRDVVIWLPLENHPAVTAPTVAVGHRELLAIVLGASTDIRSLDFHNPTIVLRERPDGTWNVQEAARLWAEALARRPRTPGGPIDIPELACRDGTLLLQRADGRTVNLPFQFSAAPRVADVEAALNIPGVAAADARVAPDAAWTHVVNFSIEDAYSIAALFIDAPPSSIGASGVWRGTVRDGRLRGEAHFDRLTYGPEHARGALFINAGAGPATLRASDLTIAGGRIPGGSVVIRSGEASVANSVISASGVLAEWLGASISLDGAWDPGQRRGDLRASWSGVIERAGITQFGALAVHAELPRAGLGSIRAELSAEGDAFGGRWRLVANAAATGRSWTEFETSLDLPTFVWSDSEGPIDLGGAHLGFITRWPTIRMVRFDSPRAEVNAAAAEFNAATFEWAAQLDISQWRIPRLNLGAFTFNAEASGDRLSATLPRFSLASSTFEFAASADYNPAATPPFTAVTIFAAPPPTRTPEPVLEPESPAAGVWTAEAGITGTLRPLDVRAAGQATVEDVQLPGGQLRPVTFDWSARATPGGAQFSTAPFRALRGTWTVRADYPRGGPPSASVNVEGLPLRRVADAADLPLDAAGLLAAELTLVAHSWRTEDLELTGRWSVESPRAGRYAVQSGSGRISSTRGRVELSDIVLRLDEGTLGGNVSFNLARPHLLALNLSSRNWPMRIQGTEIVAAVDGTARAGVDLLERRARGRFELTAPITIGGEPYGTAHVAGRIRDRTLLIYDLLAQIAGGEISGTLRLPFDQWHNTETRLAWRDLSVPDLLAPWPWARGSQSSGVLSGLLTAAPSTSPRAPEPLRINVLLTPDGASFRGLTLGESQIVAYAGPDAAGGTTGRLIVDESSINLAGGLINLWSRLSFHNGQPFVHTQASVSDLNIDALVHAITPDAPPVPGKITGRISGGAYIFEPRRIFARATVFLEDSDLAYVPVVSALYGLLNFLPRDLHPTGIGAATLRLEDYTVLINDVRYFNRGIDIVGSGRIDDLRRGAASPVSGVAVARVRPLRDPESASGGGLPLVSDVDELLAALQSGGASIVISGTVADRHMDRATQAQIREAARRATADSSR